MRSRWPDPVVGKLVPYGRAIAVAMLFSPLLTACSHAARSQERIPYACLQPSPSSGQRVTLTGQVIDEIANSLHMDFEWGGADFDSVVIRFNGPGAWNGVIADIYHQGGASPDYIQFGVGTAVEFPVVPPSCLDQPWLFLSEIKPIIRKGSDHP